MPPPELETFCAHFLCPARKADLNRPYQTDARSFVQAVLRVAAAAACRAHRENAADWHTRLPSHLLYHPSCEFHGPVRPPSCAHPIPSGRRLPHCCDTPCLPPLPRLPKDALHTSLRESFPQPTLPLRCRPRSRLPAQSPYRRWLRHAW